MMPIATITTKYPHIEAASGIGRRGRGPEIGTANPRLIASTSTRACFRWPVVPLAAMLLSTASLAQGFLTVASEEDGVMRGRWAVLLALAATWPAQQAFGWGATGHEWATGIAIEKLPDEV